MYTAYIGKQLIQAINQRDGTTHTPRTFFDDVFYPCFFANERFLLDTNNAPPGQAYKQKGKTPLTPSVLAITLSKVHAKIEGGDVDASIYMGGPSSDTKATTSGQVTNIHRDIPPDDVYASWIGTGLGATVEGGLSLLLDDDEPLLALYEGWREYRCLLDQTPNLKPHQINTWNGQWLTYRLGKAYNPAVNHTWQTNADGSGLETQTWVQLLFALSHHYHKTPGKTLTAYVYAFGQMNRTLGFARLNLPEVYALADLYNELFTVPPGMVPASFEELYKTENGFKRACQNVAVGLRALQPKDLRAYMDGSKKPDNAERTLQFQTYQTWIIAMLNNKDLSTRAEALAEALHQYGQSSRSGKTTETRQAEEVLDSKNRLKFIEALTAITEKLPDEHGTAELFNTVVEEVITMPTDNVPLFLTLVRFKYAYLSKKSNTPAQTALPE